VDALALWRVNARFFVASLARPQFRHFLTNGTILGKTLVNIKCVFLFSLRRLSKTLLILKIIQ
jgi:hypothetical protein